VLEALQGDAMVVAAPGILGDPGRLPVGRVVLREIVVEHHDDRAGVAVDALRFLPLAGLAVQVAHRTGPAGREPAVELDPMQRRAQVGDAAGHETQALGFGLDVGAFEGWRGVGR
jgi:hypothetical protein